MPDLAPLMPLSQQLFREVAFKRLTVELSLGRPSEHRSECSCGDAGPHFRFHFFHGGVLRALLGSALETHDLPLGIMPYAAESGQHGYLAGDAYRFGVTLAGGALKLEDQLLEGLRRVGRFPPRRQGAILGGNFSIVRADTVAHTTLDAFCASHATACGAVVLRAVSPLRVPQPIGGKGAKGRYLDRDKFPLAPLLNRMVGRVHAMARGVYPERADRPLLAGEPPTDLRGAGEGLTWLDVPIGDAVRDDPSHRGGPKKLGGAVGSVLLGAVDPAWFPWLLAAEALHAGENTAFALGAVALQNVGADAVAKWCAPARTLLDRTLDDGEVAAACVHMATNAGSDRIDEAAIRQTATEIRQRRFRPTARAGWAERMKDGRIRGLSVSPMRERVLQRAAAQVLMPSANLLLDDCAFAYRKGYSVQGAKRAIEQAMRDGFEWVLDTDIRAFFDTVDQARLERLLRALFPDEPLVDLLLDWLRAPVRFGDSLIAQPAGLPQGLAISPVLANLYLDELDEAVLGADFRLVRYADDFVVLCRDEAKARRALALVQAVIARLGMTLHEDKTSVVPPGESFLFLGQHFRARTVRESSEPQQDQAEWTPLSITSADVPRYSWLASVPLEKVRRLVKGVGAEVRLVEVTPSEREVPRPPATRSSKFAASADVTEPAANVATEAPIAERTSATIRHSTPLTRIDAHHRRLGRPMYVMRAGATLRLRADVVQVLDGETVLQAVPVRALAYLALSSGARASTPLVLRLADAGVPVYFVRRSGRLRASLNGTFTLSVWEAQFRAVESMEQRVAFARVVLLCRLRQQQALMRTRSPSNAARVEAFDALALGMSARNTLDELRGTEGQGSKLLFSALREQIADTWTFHGRVRRPPPDPINVMLSFGYTILHQCVVTALTIAGCNPRLGLLHEVRAGHDALASDLQEEWRHLVEQLVWELATSRAPWDGFAPDARLGCRMSGVWQREYAALVLSRICEERVGPAGEGISVLERIGAQAVRAREWMTGHASEFLPMDR